MFFQKYKTIIAFAVVFIIGFIVYTYFLGNKGSDEGDGLVSDPLVKARTGENVVGAEIKSALNQISALTLDRTIFQDPVYRTLIDRSVEITLQPGVVGKADPFAPINSSARFVVGDDFEFQDSKATTTKAATTTRVSGQTQ
jgi:hypothetical protein